MQKPAGPKGKLRQARASQAASAGCAVFAKAGFLCDNKRHPFEEIIRPVGAAGAQVPYKHKVTGSNPVPATIETAGQTFFVWPFLFSGRPKAYRTKRASKLDASAQAGASFFAGLNSATQAFHPYVAPIKNGRQPAPTPENQRAFHAESPTWNSAENGRAFRFTNPRRAGARARVRLARRKPDFLPARQKGRRHSRRPSSYADPLRQPGKTPVEHAEALRGGRAAPYSPCTPFTAPSISRAWARDASVASPESIRAISAGRSSADSRRRQVWGIPSSPAILVTA